MQDLLLRILDYCAHAGLFTLRQLLIVFGVSMLLAFIMNYLNLMLLNQSIRLMGTKTYIILFAWIGVPVHELGHALFALIFGHKITKIVLFKPSEPGGLWGYVNHTYNSRSIYQRIGNFFIGIGPIIVGSVVIYLLGYFLLNFDIHDLLKDSRAVDYNADISSIFTISLRNILSISISVIHNILHNLLQMNWRYIVFLYLSFSIGNYINLSPTDVKHLAPGFLILTVTLLIANLATVWLGGFSILWLQQNQLFFSMFHAILLLVMGLCVLFLLIIALLNKLCGR